MAATDIKNVIILGASGTIGSHVLSVLTEPGSPFTITIWTRPDSKAELAKVPDTVKIVRQEYTLENLKSVFQSQDAVVSVTSVFTIELQKVILEAAQSAGVKRFILNEYANSPVYQTGLPELMMYREVKDEVRKYADSLAQKDSNFTWTGIAIGCIIDLSLEKYPIFGFDLKQDTAKLVDDGTEPFTGVTLRDCGIAARGVLLNPRETANRYVHIRSAYTTQQEILKDLEAETGKEWPVSYVDSSSLYESGRKAFAAGDRVGMLQILVVQLFEKGSNRSVVVPAEKSDNELLGVKERPVSVIVKQVLRSVKA